ncbi:MAG TPA: lysophospholipid acyltransferase family protein [Candidatus Acidoferrum sp.]|nr:lysophospholipid acyltransferase family protein [Candidatus Acidoferrum sp.]
MLTLRSILFYLVYAASLALWSSLCVLTGWLLPLKARYPFFVQWNRFAVWWVGVCCGVKYEIVGHDNIPREPFVLLSNHQSPWETVFLYYQFRPLCAVLKRELLRIPFFGWALWLLDPIAIDRSKRRDARESMMAQGRKQLDHGINILVFPEGTRGAPGADRKYYTGGAELAIANGARVLPVAHDAGVYWPAHKLVKKPGTIRVIIGKPIDTAGREPRELTEQVKQWVASVQASP